MAFHYMLRRNLPLWCVEETVRDTIRFCRQCSIDDVIWKADAEEFNSGFTPPEILEKYLVALRFAKSELERNGIGFSINPWLTQNHASRGRYSRKNPPDGFAWRVNSQGMVMADMACPLAPGWRRWLLQTYRQYASLKPKMLWIEDDFKTFLHDSAFLGCFCDEHRRRFAPNMSREELVRKICDDPQVRRKWLNDNATVLLDICREVEKTVHEISPDTRLGQMCSWSSDSRWWRESIQILAGKNSPLARTSLSSYMECLPMDLLPDCGDFRKESAALPQGTENVPELENAPYTAYAKSAATTRQQILQAAFDGCRGITMNLFDMVGSSTDEEPRYAVMLQKLKPRLDALITPPDAEDSSALRGVGVPFKVNYADSLPSGTDNFRFDGDYWMTVLAACGIPTGFQLQNAPVQALTGHAVSMLSDEEVTGLLRNGVILDGCCASALLARGFGPLLGIAGKGTCSQTELALGAERDENGYMSLRILREDGAEAIFHAFRMRDGAKAHSTIVNWQHKELFPGWILFENSLGGRCAIYALEITARLYPCFLNWKRRSQMQTIVSWLSQEKPALLVDGGAWMASWRRDWKNTIELSILNYDHDAWDSLRLRFASPWKHPLFQRLSEDGKWLPIQPAEIRTNNTMVDVSFNWITPPFGDVIIRVFPK